MMNNYDNYEMTTQGQTATSNEAARNESIQSKSGQYNSNSSNSNNDNSNSNSNGNGIGIGNGNDKQVDKEEEYMDPSTNDLTISTGAALIVADCMGTGILALPYNINITLGRGFGLFFLLLNVGINMYAGTILCNVAVLVEKRLCGLYESIMDDIDGDDDVDVDGVEKGGVKVPNDLNNEWNYDNATYNYNNNIDNDDNNNNNDNDNGNDNEEKHLTKHLQKGRNQAKEGEASATTQDRYQTLDLSTISNNSSIQNVHKTEDHEIMDRSRAKAKSKSSIHHYDTTTTTTTTTTRATNNASNQTQDHHEHHNTQAHTFDFIGLTYALFDSNSISSNNNDNDIMKNNMNNASIQTQPLSQEQSPIHEPNNNRQTIQLSQHKPSRKGKSRATTIVIIIYYTNIFLVLGNYILVMSHAVAAMIGESYICLPNAGLIASTLMFGLCQLRSMSSLGHLVSFASLAALGVVVVQCLVSIQAGNDAFAYDDGDGEDGGFGERVLGNVIHSFTNNDSRALSGGTQDDDSSSGDYPYTTMFQSLVRQFASLSSIGFAVGSQKLLLNIRHEFKDRTEAVPSLGISLGTFGSMYALVCILAGPNPPSFLFDAISPGIGRRVAGFLLWLHVSVSFAINSQALCSSIDRIKFHHVTLFSLHKYHRLRWAVLTFFVSIASFFIANAVPFFKDLVSLIGALTSVPLTLLLPAIYHRKIRGLPLCCWSWASSLRQQEDIWSFLLVFFSVTFLICGVIGSLSSIEIDWSNHGPPFACH